MIIDEVWRGIKYGLTIIGGWCGWFWGDPRLLYILISFQAVDIILGFSKSGKESKLSAAVMYWGLAGKLFTLLLIGFAHVLDGLLNVGGTIMTATAFYYIACEGLSIMEKAVFFQIPLPPVVKNALEVLRKSGEDSKK